MERRSGLWIASTPLRPWALQGRPATNRKSDVNLRFEGGMFQLWEGFGGGVSERGWNALTLLKGGGRLRALHALFNHEEGCRFHYARTPLGVSGASRDAYSPSESLSGRALKSVSMARDLEALIPFLRIPLDRIRKFKTVACPWSPPDWMKEVSGSGCGRIKWGPRILEAYAIYLAGYIQGFRKAGIQIDHLLIQNNPGDLSVTPGCYWTGAQLRDFIRDYCGPVMARRRIPVRLWLGALDSPDYADYALTVLSDPMAMKYIDGVACQQGGQQALRRIRRAFPDIHLMQSDCGAGDGSNTWAQAQATFAGIQQAITAGVEVCLYDNLVLPAGGRTLTGRSLNSLIAVNETDLTVVLNPDYYVMRHFSCLVDRYAIRLGLAGEWADRAVAFYNDGDESRVLIIHNPEPGFRRVVLDDGDRRLAMTLQPHSFNTMVL